MVVNCIGAEQDMEVRLSLPVKRKQRSRQGEEQWSIESSRPIKGYVGVQTRRNFPKGSVHQDNGRVKVG